MIVPEGRFSPVHLSVQDGVDPRLCDVQGMGPGFCAPILVEGVRQRVPRSSQETAGVVGSVRGPSRSPTLACRRRFRCRLGRLHLVHPAPQREKRTPAEVARQEVFGPFQSRRFVTTVTFCLHTACCGMRSQGGSRVAFSTAYASRRISCGFPESGSGYEGSRSWAVGALSVQPSLSSGNPGSRQGLAVVSFERTIPSSRIRQAGTGPSLDCHRSSSSASARPHRVRLQHHQRT